MKHINGFEFAKILRKKDLSIPIVFQTKKYTLWDIKLSSTSDALLIKAT